MMVERYCVSTERLQKVLASAGVASRRDCEELMASGRVMVNGRVVRELGTRIDIEQDTVTVDGTPIRLPDVRTYIMVHKPVGVVSTVDDPQGRPTVIDLVNVSTRVFPVGRLDVDSEGLMLLTNDGELTHCLTHPGFEIEKEYHVLLDRVPDAETLRQWRAGVELAGERTAPAEVHLLDQSDAAWVAVVLREGRKRQIREVARLLGYKVERLIRVREDSLVLADLPVGQWRNLRPEEVQTLRSHMAPTEYDPQSTNQRQPRAPLRPSSITRRRKQPDESGSGRRDYGQQSTRPHRSAETSLSNGRSRSAERGLQGRSNTLAAADARGGTGRSSSIAKRSANRSHSARSAGAAGSTSGIDRSRSPESVAGNKRVRSDQPSRREKPAPNRAWRERQDEERRARQSRSGSRPGSRYSSVRRGERPSAGTQSGSRTSSTRQSSARFSSGTSRSTWKVTEDEQDA